MNSPRNYREEAARIRAVAAPMDDDAKAQLMKIADLYDRLAGSVENRPERPSAASAPDSAGDPRH